MLPMAKDEIGKYTGTYFRELEIHPNPLARNILNFSKDIRHTAALDLRGTYKF